MNQYSNAYSYFLDRDRLEQIEKLILEYNDVHITCDLISKSNNYTDIIKNENIIALNNTKNIIFRCIQKLDKNITRENLELFSTLSILKEKTAEEIKYNILLNDIKSKKLFFLKNVIDEIKLHLIKLGGDKTQNGFDINEVIDSEIITRLIVHKKTLSNNDISNYGDYLIKIINELQSPISIDSTNHNWNSLKNSNIDYEEYLAKMLFMILLEIKAIKEAIINLDIASKIGIDIFQ
jgi:hypothetical protein